MKSLSIIAAIALFLLYCVPDAAGSKSAAAPKSNDAQARAVMSDPDLIYGIGNGPDRQEATQAALADLVSKISVTVSADNTSSAFESLGPDGLESTSEFRSVVRSYSTPASLEGVQSIWLSAEAPYEVVMYMPRSKVARVFERRRDNVAHLVREGMRAEAQGQIDDALRYLYRAFAVLRSVPEYTTVGEVIDGRTRMLAEWIPQQIREICSGVSFGIAGVRADGEGEGSGRLIDLTARYKGEPVRSVAFTYQNGPQGRSGIVTARNGMAEILLHPQASLSPLVLDIEYRFADDNHINPEYQPLLESFNGAGLGGDGAHFALTSNPGQLKADKKESKAFEAAVAAGAAEGVAAVEKKVGQQYVPAIERIVKAITMRDYTSVRDLFTEESYGMFHDLVSYGKARILGKAAPTTYSFYPMGDRMVCRSVPMSFSFENGRRQFTEEVTFTFAPDGLIESVAFGLGNVTREAIFAMQGEAWTDYRKMVIATFLENYRTAFALKRLDYIRSIFADNAVIIVGHVTKRMERVNTGDGFAMKNEDHVTYVRKSKEEYMAQLERCFRSNQFINIRFTGTDVEKTGYAGDVFAIQLHQEYVSSSYGDEGYLYLMVDFDDPENPSIKVRTWQPERRPELTPYFDKDSPLHGLISTGYFD